MKEVKKGLTEEEKIIADEVADEILTVKEEDRNHFILLLLFLICLIFLVSSLSFAIFDTYYNGGNANVIDVGIDVDVKDKDHHKPIQPSSVLFSYNESSNYIHMENVFPTSDSIGKKLNGYREYFDFNVSAFFNNVKKGNMIYEIALVPVEKNTISEDLIRVNLTEDGKDVSVSGKDVNTFSDLPDSSYFDNGKVIYRKSVKKNYNANYVFRMWVSADADVADVVQRFGCKVAVYAYYK